MSSVAVESDVENSAVARTFVLAWGLVRIGLRFFFFMVGIMVRGRLCMGIFLQI